MRCLVGLEKPSEGNIFFLGEWVFKKWGRLEGSELFTEREFRKVYYYSSHTPEIHDVWVSEKHRGNGIGKRLVQYLEGLAQQENHKQIGIGVGLYKDYGRAQRLYVHLGYVPDGHGVTSL